MATDKSTRPPGPLPPSMEARVQQVSSRIEAHRAEAKRDSRWIHQELSEIKMSVADLAGRTQTMNDKVTGLMTRAAIVGFVVSTFGAGIAGAVWWLVSTAMHADESAQTAHRFISAHEKDDRIHLRKEQLAPLQQQCDAQKERLEILEKKHRRRRR